MSFEGKNISAVHSWDVGSIINFNDLNGDEPQKFQFKDEGFQNLWEDDQATDSIDASSIYETDNIGNLIVRGNQDSSGDLGIQVRVFDGIDWSIWYDLPAYGGQNGVPELSINDISIYINNNIKFFDDLIFDYDFQHLSDWNGHQEYYELLNGQRIAMKYEIKDTSGEQNFFLSQYEDGSSPTFIDASNGYIFTGDDLKNSNERLFIKADNSASSQTLQMRAWDGKEWGEWDNFILETKSLISQVDTEGPVLNSVSIRDNSLSPGDTLYIIYDASDESVIGSVHFYLYDSLGNYVVASDYDDDGIGGLRYPR